MVSISFEIRDNLGERIETWDLNVGTLREYKSIGKELLKELIGTEDQGWLVTTLEGNTIGEMRII